MEEIIVNVDWVATIVATVVAFLVGWAWYGPLFGKQWMAGVGMSESDKGSMAHPMVAQLAGTFLLAWLIGLVAGMNSPWTAALIAATIAVIIKANGLFVRKSHTAIMVESIYILVMVLVMYVVHTMMM